MKNTICAGLLLVILQTIGFGQDLAKVYGDTLIKALGEYDMDDYVVQNKLVAENLATAFSYVVFSSSDLATNTSSFGYVQNKDKTNVSINGNFKVCKACSNTFVRFGGTATGSSSLFDLYSQDSWKNNVGINIGILKRFLIKYSGVYFTSNQDSFNLQHQRRSIESREPIYNQPKYSSITVALSQQLADEIAAGDYKRLHQNLSQYRHLFRVEPKLKKFIDSKNYIEAYNLSLVILKQVSPYVKATQREENLLAFIKDTVLYDIDKRNDATYGYNMQWVDANINISNSTYGFTGDNIDSMATQILNTREESPIGINKAKIVATLSFNKTLNGKYGAYYGQIGTSITSGSFMESPLLQAPPKLTFENENLVVIDDTGNTMGAFDRIEDRYTTGAIFLYVAGYLNKQKNFGVNFALGHNYIIDQPSETFYDHNYTLLFGPIFRKINKDQTSLTFSIDAGWENAPYDSDRTNDFLARIRVGVPFNVYNKKK